MAALICKDPSDCCGTPSTTKVRNLATFSRVGRRSLNAAEASVAACHSPSASSSRENQSR
jgi:ribosomal protein L37E